MRHGITSKAGSKTCAPHGWTWPVITLFLTLLLLLAVAVLVRGQNTTSESLVRYKNIAGLKDSKTTSEMLAAMNATLTSLQRQLQERSRADAAASLRASQQKQPSEQDAFTRSRVYAGEWGSNAVLGLRRWRSDLFARVARMYRVVEMAETDEGKVQKRVEPGEWRRYDVANPFVSCPMGALQRVGGDEDGGKELCLQGLLDQPGCIVYSLGSNGDYSFEQGILKVTPCKVYTLDCTYNGTSLDGSTRHFYHKVCLGSDTVTVREADEERVYWDYPTLLSKLGHVSKRVSLLKIDIEGFEYDLLSEWQEKYGCTLPMQIAMEVHFKFLYVMGTTFPEPDDFSHLLWGKHELSLGEVALWFSHFANLGYAVVNREDNPGSHCCAEFTLLQVEQPAGCPLMSLPDPRNFP